MSDYFSYTSSSGNMYLIPKNGGFINDNKGNCTSVWDNNDLKKLKNKPEEEIENPENVDFSLVCMTAEIKMDKQETEKVELEEKENGIHQHYTTRFIPFIDYEDVLVGKLKENLDVFPKYIQWVKDKTQYLEDEKYVLAHEALEDYLCSRMLNIHNILMPFFINNEISNEDYSNYIGANNLLQKNLENDLHIQDEFEHRFTLILTFVNFVEIIYKELYDMYLNN